MYSHLENVSKMHSLVGFYRYHYHFVYIISLLFFHLCIPKISRKLSFLCLKRKKASRPVSGEVMRNEEKNI